MLKNWGFRTVVLEKSLESPLDCKEIKPVHPKVDQSWIFTGQTDAESETPIIWAPDAKNWLIGNDPDAGKDWRQEEKGSTEDEMFGWQHQLDGDEFDWEPGAGDGQGSLACCSPWSHKAAGHDWAAELNDWNCLWSFAGGSSCNTGAEGDVSLILGVGRSPGGGHENPLQYSCLENTTDRRAWWSTVYRVAKSWTRLKRLSKHACTNCLQTLPAVPPGEGRQNCLQLGTTSPVGLYIPGNMVIGILKEAARPATGRSIGGNRVKPMTACHTVGPDLSLSSTGCSRARSLNCTLAQYLSSTSANRDGRNQEKRVAPCL